MTKYVQSVNILNVKWIVPLKVLGKWHLLSAEGVALSGEKGLKPEGTLENPIKLGAEGAKLSQAKGQRFVILCIFWELGLPTPFFIFSGG